MSELDHIVVDIPGGFGNQLFGYAFGYALSQNLGCKLWIDTTYQDNGITWENQLKNLNIECDRILSYKWTKKILDRAFFNKIRRKSNVGWFIDKKNEYELSQTFDFTQIKNNTYFVGNWENEKYFNQYREVLIEMFTPNKERSISFNEVLEEITSTEYVTVGMHVRRGDKLAMGSFLPADYYNDAIKTVDEVLKKCEKKIKYFIFSDDIEWCKNNILSEDDNIFFPEYESDNYAFDDWLLLKACDHHIIGNSTFSWWAAWLKPIENHIVVMPESGRKYYQTIPDGCIIK